MNLIVRFILLDLLTSSQTSKLIALKAEVMLHEDRTCLHRWGYDKQAYQRLAGLDKDLHDAFLCR